MLYYPIKMNIKLQEKARMRNCIIPLLILGLAILLSSCNSIDYEARAVKKAREYAIKNLPAISEKTRHHIKYTVPAILQSDLLIRDIREKKEGNTSKKDIVQTCIVWEVPDEEKNYLLVAGVSERRLDDWSPIRVVQKKFYLPDRSRRVAVTTAINYAMSKMQDLSDSVRLRIRFTDPEVLKTNFFLELGKKLKEESAKVRKELMQISFVWDSDKEGEKVVVTGLGEEDLTQAKTLKSVALKELEKERDELKEKRVFEWRPLVVSLRKADELEPLFKEK